MSSVPTLKREPNGVVYMHWTVPGPRGSRGRSKRQSTGTDDMAAAKIYLGQWLLMERAEVPDGKKLTVADLWAIYDEKRVAKVVAPGTLRTSWKNLAPHFGAKLLSEIDDDSVEQYIAKRMDGRIGFRPAPPAPPERPLPYKPPTLGTVRRELIALKACFNWCAKPKRKIITKADLPDFDLPPEGQPRDRWLSHDEIQALLTTAGEMRQGERLSRTERFLWIALETGSRKTAISQLTWDRVDFGTNVIHYNVPGRARTKKRRGDVPISAALRPVLQRAHAERLNELVMDTETNVGELIATVARRAGVADVSPHVLRHTAATHMVRRGVPIFKVAKILAISIATAERTYAHHCPDDLREAVDTISAGVLEAAQ